MDNDNEDNHPNENDKDLSPFDNQNEEASTEDLLKLEEPQEEPLGFLNNEEETDNGTEEKEDFELIESTEIPSIEEAEHHLEIVRLEAERKKKEEEEKQKLEEDERGVDDGEEVTDGGAC